MFSTTYFSHHKDNIKECSIVQAYTLAGIAVGWSDVTNGLQVYNPITKELCTISIFNINEHIMQGKPYVNLAYDDGIFSGPYSVDLSVETLPNIIP